MHGNANVLPATSIRDIMKRRTGWVRASNAPQIDLKVTLTAQDAQTRYTARTLIDSGCTQSSVDIGFVRRYKLATRDVSRAVPVHNADGSLNGYVKEHVEIPMEIIDSEGTVHRETIDLQVINLGGKHDIFLGYDWLQRHNPLIDWQNKEFSFARCPGHCDRELAARNLEALPNYVRRLNSYDDDGYKVEETLPAYVRRLNSYEDSGFKDERHVRASQTKSTEITAEAPKGDKVTIPPQYAEFSDVFEKAKFDQLPDRKTWDHAIELKSGWETDRKLKGRVYPLGPKEQSELDKFIDENLATGRIRPSKSPVAAPFFFIKKKDGELRPVQDYRRINAATVRDSWPLPVIGDVVTRIKDAKYFSKFDVRWGFNNVRIKEGDEWKAAFITNRGLFEPLVMFFGLTNSPATFQHMMDDIFIDLLRAGKIIVYLDDILVFSNTLEEHRRTVREVLQRLRKHKLFLKLEKCKFEQNEMDFLGIVVKNGHVAMDPIKTRAVEKWPTPKSLKEVRSFMQFCNFYRAFIPNFADITVPFNELTRKNVKFVWEARQEAAFRKLKEVIARDITLLLPVPGARFRLETDASDYAVGAVLHQIIDGKPRPIAFFSKAFDEAARNWPVYDKELCGVVYALAHWPQHLRNAPEFDIWTDHLNLQYFRDPQKLNRRQARWAMELADYNFKLHYHPGKLNVVADALSRMDEPEGGVKGDNANTIVLKNEWFSDSPDTTRVNRLSFRDEEEILEEIRRRRQQCDKKVEQGLLTQSKDYKETNGVVEYKGLIYVPRDRTLRDRILYAHHDTPLMGHPGRNQTVGLIQRNYWWPGLRGHAAKYVSACETCQRTKPRQGAIAAPLHPHDPPSAPWEVISADMIGPLSKSNGFDAIFVIVDRLTKMVIAVPSTVDQTAEGTARIFRDHVFKRFGVPKKVISDRGPQFVSNFMTEFYRMVGITANPSTAYHPQTDGQTERANAEVEKYLRAWINTRQDDWAEWLAIAEFAINNRTTTATGVSPFELNYGRHPNVNVAPRRTGKNEAASTFVRDMQDAAKEAEAALKLAADTMKAQTDKHRQPSRNYIVGQRVWLEATNINFPAAPGATKKLMDRRVGPFKILKKIGPSAYRLQLPRGWKRMHPVFNEALLTPFVPPEAEHQKAPPPPPPDIIEGKPEYDVEEVLNSRRQGRNGIQYLVLWKGYPREDATWEPPSNMARAEEAISDFHKLHPKAFKKPNGPPQAPTAHKKPNGPPAPRGVLRRSPRQNRPVRHVHFDLSPSAQQNDETEEVPQPQDEESKGQSTAVPYCVVV